MIQKRLHYTVIGSGPSGLASASALLGLGAAVTLVDIGADLTEASRSWVEALSRKLPGDWRDDERAWLRRGLDSPGEKIPLKKLFGESFMYAREKPLPAHFGQWPSRGIGGFSRVWGATLKRFSANDLAQWPLDESGLRDHYDAAERLLGETGAPSSNQSAALLEQWRQQAGALTELGARVSPASLAVSPACKLCGMCLTGCPYGYIFSSDTLVHRYQSRDGFAYRPGLTVQHIQETGNGVEVVAAKEGGGIERLTADRVFVAAGPLATARLMLSSFGSAADHLTLRDGQYFLLPFLTWPAPQPESAHTLSQLFIEIADSLSSIHVQLYGQNRVYGAAIAAAFGPLASLARPLARHLGRHFLLAQGYLRSDDSGSADLSVERGELRIQPQLSPRTSPALRQVWRRLGKIGRLAGLHALTSLASQAEIGRGYHTGATMPMARQPSGWHSDILGRVKGLERVHVVDASVWTDIPSGPVTLTAMANAHRIATLAGQQDVS